MLSFKLTRALSLLQMTACAYPVRIAILKMMGARIGTGTTIGRGVYFETGLLKAGANVRIGAASRIDNAAEVVLGDWVRMGPEVAIITSTHRVIAKGPFRRTHDDLVMKGVVIERGCWICARAVILPGVTIAEGCVIAAGSVVHKNTIPNGKYAGNPARLIGRYEP